MARTNGAVAAKAGELSALQKAWRKGAQQFKTEADRNAAKVAELQRAADKLNAQTKALFRTVNESLGAERLAGVRTQEELEAELKRRSNALDHLVEAKTSKLTEEQKAKFRDLRAKRQAEINAIMADKDLTMEEKIARIQAVDAGISGELTALQGEVMVTAEEVQQTHNKMVQTEAAIFKALDAEQQAVSAEELIVLESGAAQDSALASRAAGMKSAMRASMGSLSANQEAAIEAVDKHARAALQGLASRQVAEEQQLGQFIQ